MILGFRASINNDTHRLFITRLVNLGVKFCGIKSQTDGDFYSFIYDSEDDFRLAQKLKRVMVKTHPDIPVL